MENKFTDYLAEKSVIGGVLIANDETEEIAISAMESLTEDDFTSAAHRIIFKAMRRMMNSGVRVDLILLSGELDQSGESGVTGGFAYLAECAKNTPSITALPAYVQKIKDLTNARKTLAVLHGGISKITAAGVNNLTDVVGEVQSSISSMDTGSVVETQHIMDGVTESINILESMLNGDLWKHKTQFGLQDIDSSFGGFNNTDFIVVGGRPGMGKTMFSTAITKTIGLKQRKPVVFYSLEMPTWQISERIAFHHGRVDKQSLLGDDKAKINQEEAWAKLSNALGDIQESPIYINDRPSMSIHEIRADARKMHKKTGGLGVIIVDYLQKMKMTNPENMNQSVGEIATGLKNLAKELKCPVVALAQLNRNLEQRVNKRPVNADLRESGVIEQEADVIFMIYRDEKYNPQTDLKGVTEVICTKSRHAPGAEKTYYFTNTHGGLDQADLTRINTSGYQDDIEC
ncbi:replicative DNA helicase [Morganella morganii]|jgi:replicative DNA helicase|uniref:replicative DNA helicase n=1 Tax=Morganella morganii TaxID=582 RepID=UPI001BDB219B|nr:replicative DNA helicase [Morganella morganii]MBT0432650.1 replicative DNA helicase [Morganella morganii subsp. morganii]HEI8419529.1 replicative DNA helicase [Morganella morganii]